MIDLGPAVPSGAKSGRMRTIRLSLPRPSGVHSSESTVVSTNAPDCRSAAVSHSGVIPSGPAGMVGWLTALA